MPFRKGQSGNPTGSGGPLGKKRKQIADMLSHLVPRVAKVLENCLEDPDMQIEASKIVLERVFGKAPQSLALTDPEGNKIELTLKIKK